MPSQPVEPGLPRLVLIVGPTAVGKTAAAVELADRMQAEIISADSRLFYRGMDIGTAKPGLDERRGVPHHLVDVADPDETWSLAVFQQRARAAIAAIHARGRLPFLVGGTGQYVRAVVQGWQPPAVEPDPPLRAAIEAWAEQIGSLALHDRLRRLDPVAAGAIDYRNRRRTVRALEVIFTTGRLFSAQRGSGPPLYHLLSLGLTLPRPELYTRIDARIQEMLSAGLVDEVRRLMSRGYSSGLPSMSAIGYREIAAHLLGQISLEEAVRRIGHSTRVYVRRQTNWFKLDDPQIRWFSAGPEAVDQMEVVLRGWLEQN